MPDFEGFEVVIGGRTYICPELNMKGVRKVLPLIRGFEGKTEEDKVGDAATILSLALTRNYPELTPDFIEENTGAKEMLPLLESIGKLMEACGFGAVGEFQTMAGNLTGDVSTPISLPQRDTPGEK